MHINMERLPKPNFQRIVQRRRPTKELAVKTSEFTAQEPPKAIDLLTSGESTAEEKLANYQKVLFSMPHDIRITGSAEMKTIVAEVDSAKVLVAHPNLTVAELVDAQLMAELNQAPQSHKDWINVQLDTANKEAARKAQKAKEGEVSLTGVLAMLVGAAGLMSVGLTAVDAIHHFIEQPAPIAGKPASRPDNVPMAPVVVPSYRTAPQAPQNIRPEDLAKEAAARQAAQAMRAREELKAKGIEVGSPLNNEQHNGPRVPIPPTSPRPPIYPNQSTIINNIQREEVRQPVVPPAPPRAPINR
jgi:hypothetical protein